ncbi:hypothetical protein ACOSQ4_006935 [Xanthoceras sorbifolium]
MRSLSGPGNKKQSMNSLAIAAGIRQKENVNKIVKNVKEDEFVSLLHSFLYNFKRKHQKTCLYMLLLYDIF